MPHLTNITLRIEDSLDVFQAVGAPFLRSILELDWDECILTAESRLSDFTGRAMPRELLPSTLDALCETWDQWVLERVQATYGLHLPDTSARLLDIFRQLTGPTQPTTLH